MTNTTMKRSLIGGMADLSGEFAAFGTMFAL